MTPGLLALATEKRRRSWRRRRRCQFISERGTEQKSYFSGDFEMPLATVILQTVNGLLLEHKRNDGV